MKKLILLIIFLLLSIPLLARSGTYVIEVTYEDGSVILQEQKDSPSRAIHFDVYGPGQAITSARVLLDDQVDATWSGKRGDDHNIYDSSCTEVYWHWVLTPSKSKVLTISSSECNTTIELQGACFRMLSSPSSEASYSDLLSDIFTQGSGVQRASSFHIQAGDPNVWTYNTLSEDWEFIPDLDANTVPGQGILLSMFADQNPTGASQTGPISLFVSGAENPNTSFSLKSGWNLLGNPFYSSIDLSSMDYSDTNGIVYVWDRNSSQWRHYSNSPLLGVSKIDNNKLSPYQGFFIESTGGGIFEFDSASKTAGGTFYGKGGVLPDHITLQVEASDTKATTTISFNSPYSDVVELNSLAMDYISFSSVRPGGTLAHIANHEDKSYIPLNIDSTFGGDYTITVSSLQMFGDLYFVDRERNIKVKIDSNFSYTFRNTSKIANVLGENACNINITQKEQSSDRFYLTAIEDNTELPSDITLNQNYPNPFNPSTQIQYSLTQTSNVSLEVFTMLGQRVGLLINEVQVPGTYTATFDAADLPSGTYIYRLSTDSKILNKKMTLIK